IRTCSQPGSRLSPAHSPCRHTCSVRVARKGEHMHRIARPGLAALLLCAVFTTRAGADELGPEPDIVVTATRSPITIDDAIVPVVVITRQDIEQSLAADLAELLRFEAGLDIGRQGGPGAATSVFMRGTESNH